MKNILNDRCIRYIYRNYCIYQEILPSSLRCSVKYVPKMFKFEKPSRGVIFLADILVTCLTRL